MKHTVVWHTAQPLWSESLKDTDAKRRRFRAPALLRFKGDDFMAQLARTLSTRPEGMAKTVARRESWRNEEAGWLAQAQAATAQPPKLYQPAHYRFYLVAAALVCQLPGLPERRIDAAQRESASFVVRRLVPRAGASFDPEDDATYDEYGWFGTQQQGTWLPVAVADQIADDEERIPLFPSAPFQLDGRKRRLLAGLVPVARRDVYEAGAGGAAAPATAAELRADDLSSPAAAAVYEIVLPGLTALSAAATLNSTDAEVRTAAANVLLDLARFLQTHVAPVWNALDHASAAGLSTTQAALWSHLDGRPAANTRRFREVLTQIATKRTQIESGQVDAALMQDVLGAPLGRSALRGLASSLLSGSTLRTRLLNALADPRLDAFQHDVAEPLAALAQPGTTDPQAQDALLMALLALSDFLQAELSAVAAAVAGGDASGLSGIELALYQQLTDTPVGPTTLSALVKDSESHRLDILAGRITPEILVIASRLNAAQITAVAQSVPALTTRVNAALAAAPLPDQASARAQVALKAPAQPVPAYYGIRCVYERPHCAGFHGAVVSEPSPPFELASFFDADAPVRPIRIAMPEVGLDKLRRSPRGVSIAVSKELRKQIERVRKMSLKNLDEGDLGSAPSVDFGLVCSLSIPIVTICALILLMIIVQLLNIVFWWLPYFILCLPRIGRSG